MPFADVVFKSVEPHSLAVAMGFAAVFFYMAVAETGTIAVKQFDVYRWFGRHQPFAWRRIRCSERCDFGDTGSDGFFTLICRKRKSGKVRTQFRILNHLPMLRCLICLEKIPQCRIFRVKQLKLKNWMIEFDGFRRPMGRLSPFYCVNLTSYCQQFEQTHLNYFIMTAYPFNLQTRRSTICVVY